MTGFTYPIRQIAAMTDYEVSQLPTQHTIVFDDGETLTAYSRETIYTHLFLGLFAPYPRVRILKKHHIATILGVDALDTSTHLKLCTAIFQSIVEDEGLELPINKEPLLKAVYETVSEAMGKLSSLTKRNVTSIDILDFIQIAKHPKIEALRVSAQEDPRRIKYAYEESVKTIEAEPEFAENGLTKAVRSKMVKANQVTQCVVFRGFGTEVDGAIFQTPIWSNYTFGNTRFYDFVADSRTAAKSHFYADTALRDSEYMARKFRLFATVLERIVYEDCGSTEHLLWEIKGALKDSSGTTIYPGDLVFMVGKNYLDETTGQYLSIKGDEKHLIGKKIQMRSLIHCKTPDPHAVCHVCAGKLSQNISRFANLGHLGSVTTTKETTQNILSIKHVNTSSMTAKILLGEHEQHFMNTGPNGAAFFLNASLKPLKPTLTVLKDQAAGLVDISSVEDLDKITLSRISQTKLVGLSTGEAGYEVSLKVEQKNKASMMSPFFLKYLKAKGWSMDAKNNFVFDMSDWDYSLPVFIMQNKEESFVDLANQINVMVESSQKLAQRRQVNGAAVLLLQDLFDLVNSKLRVNILSFEIIIYALMVASKSNYSLSRGSKDPVLGIAEVLTKYRSLGAALVYEDQHETLTDPANFYKGKRPDSPFDVFFSPREVVEAYRHIRR